MRWCTNGEPVPSSEFYSHSTYACGLRAAAGNTEVNCCHNDVGLATDRVDFAVFDAGRARAEGGRDEDCRFSLEIQLFLAAEVQENLSFFVEMPIT